MSIKCFFEKFQKKHLTNTKSFITFATCLKNNIKTTEHKAHGNNLDVGEKQVHSTRRLLFVVGFKSFSTIFLNKTRDSYNKKLTKLSIN